MDLSSNISTAAEFCSIYNFIELINSLHLNIKFLYSRWRMTEAFWQFEKRSINLVVSVCVKKDELYPRPMLLQILSMLGTFLTNSPKRNKGGICATFFDESWYKNQNGREGFV